MSSSDAEVFPLDGAPLFLLEAVPDTEELLVDGAEGRHAVDVLRLTPGERVRIGDGGGVVAEGEVVSSDRQGLRVRVRARAEVPPQQPQLVLVQALPKGDRGPLAVELATELGVDRIVPWAAARCVTRWREDRVAKGLARWRSAARAAAKQARPPRLPEVTEPMATREAGGLPPAVDVRSTSAPSRTASTPAARNATTSPSVSPPSGPTTTATVPVDGMDSSASGLRDCSCSTTARSASASSPQTSRVVIRSVTSGTCGRRDCLLAAWAADRHFATPLAMRSSRQRVTQRDAAQGTIRSTPSSVARSTASGPRSPLGSACTRTNAGSCGGTS